MNYEALSDEDARGAADALAEHGTQTKAAEALGIARSTLQNRLRHAAERGMMLDHEPAMPGYSIKSVASKVDGKWIKQTKAPGEKFAMPDGQMLKGLSVYADSEGRITSQWIKTKEGVFDPRAIAEWLKDAFKDYKPAAPRSKPPKLVNEDLLTLIPCNDWHLGMFGWDKQVGKNWDLKIAQEAISQNMEETIFQSRQSGTGVVLVGGDLLHADNQSNETARSGNQLDVDGRYPKILTAAGMLIVKTVDCALLHHQKIIVRVLPGNHDEHSATAVALFLMAWYRLDPRVVVDVDPSLFWWHRFGKVLLGSTHGHTVKIKDMAGIMAQRRAEDWGATKWRYIHGFHLHHKEKISTEGGGVISEIHQAPIPQDAWHFNSGYLSGASLQAITYHRDRGEISRVVTAVREAA